MHRFFKHSHFTTFGCFTSLGFTYTNLFGSPWLQILTNAYFCPPPNYIIVEKGPLHHMCELSCRKRVYYSKGDGSFITIFSLFLAIHLQVIADSVTGLLFKNKRDRKIINVDPKVGCVCVCVCVCYIELRSKGGGPWDSPRICYNRNL